jgi:hypothetical protein
LVQVNIIVVYHYNWHDWELTAGTVKYKPTHGDRAREVEWLAFVMLAFASVSIVLEGAANNYFQSGTFKTERPARSFNPGSSVLEVADDKGHAVGQTPLIIFLDAGAVKDSEENLGLLRVGS